MVLYFPAHSLLSPSHDQHGHSVPSTRAIAPLVASVASPAVGRSFPVAFSTNGVRKVMCRDIVAWSTSKISAHTSSTMFLPQISAGNDECFAQGQFARAPSPFIPRLFE